MAQKLFVNNTAYQINGNLVVRMGSTPGEALNNINFTLAPQSQQYVPYGDSSDPYMDSLEISAVANGAVILSDQIVIQRSSPLDNLYNMNDTVYIAMQGQSFVITSANTWTV